MGTAGSALRRPIGAVRKWGSDRGSSWIRESLGDHLRHFGAAFRAWPSRPIPLRWRSSKRLTRPRRGSELSVEEVSQKRCALLDAVGRVDEFAVNQNLVCFQQVTVIGLD